MTESFLQLLLMGAVLLCYLGIGLFILSFIPYIRKICIPLLFIPAIGSAIVAWLFGAAFVYSYWGIFPAILFAFTGPIVVPLGIILAWINGGFIAVVPVIVIVTIFAICAARLVFILER